MIKPLAILDLRRHFPTMPTNGQETRHIDTLKSVLLAAKMADQHKLSGTKIEMIFTSSEPRTKESAEVMTYWLGLKTDTIQEQPVQSAGDDQRRDLFWYPPAFKAEMKASGRTDYFPAMIQKHGKLRAVQFALYGISGIHEVVGFMAHEKIQHGLLVGHCEMIMLVTWLILGCPDDLSVFEHGNDHLPEGEGYRIALMNDGTLQFVEHLSL